MKSLLQIGASIAVFWYMADLPLWSCIGAALMATLLIEALCSYLSPTDPPPSIQCGDEGK